MNQQQVSNLISFNVDSLQIDDMKSGINDDYYYESWEVEDEDVGSRNILNTGCAPDFKFVRRKCRPKKINWKMFACHRYSESSNDLCRIKEKYLLMKCKFQLKWIKFELFLM